MVASIGPSTKGHSTRTSRTTDFRVVSESGIVQPAALLGAVVDAVAELLNRADYSLHASAETSEQPPRQVSIDYCATRKHDPSAPARKLTTAFRRDVKDIVRTSLASNQFWSFQINIKDRVHGSVKTIKVSDLATASEKDSLPSRKK